MGQHRSKESRLSKNDVGVRSLNSLRCWRIGRKRRQDRRSNARTELGRDRSRRTPSANPQGTGASTKQQMVVSVDGIDTEAVVLDKSEPIQTKRGANAAASSAAASGEISTNKGTLSWLIDRWCASRTDIGLKPAHAIRMGRCSRNRTGARSVS
jgi:hypothetical protein